MNSPRLPTEDYSTYRTRLATEEKQFRRYKRGTITWPSQEYGTVYKVLENDIWYYKNAKHIQRKYDE